MSWLSDFLGLKKVKPLAVKKAEDVNDYDFDTTGYLMEEERKVGYEDQIQTGKKPKLAGKSYLGV